MHPKAPTAVKSGGGRVRFSRNSRARGATWLRFRDSLSGQLRMSRIRVSLPGQLLARGQEVLESSDSGLSTVL
jgi:hypothetical protein